MLVFHILMKPPKEPTSISRENQHDRIPYVRSYRIRYYILRRTKIISHTTLYPTSSIRYDNLFGDKSHCHPFDLQHLRVLIFHG